MSLVMWSQCGKRIRALFIATIFPHCNEDLVEVTLQIAGYRVSTIFLSNTSLTNYLTLPTIVEGNVLCLVPF